METFFLAVVAFLIILAVFDLVVGVSNDAVNFLNSAIGARVARFRTIVVIAAVGVFAGAAMSNGMMDVARHGIMTPQYYTFYEVMCVFLAVMVTDVILLDVFNTLGMPTSTTVSMVFELLGGTFALAMLKIFRGATDASGAVLTLGDLLNTEKAISVILGIFLSVGIAFIVGTLVMWVARMVFSFTYRVNGTTTDATGHMGSRLGSSLKIGIFAGIATTSIIWFLLINGLKGSSFMTPDVKAAIADNTWTIIGGGLLVFSAVMTLLSALKLPVLKFIVLLGTFALAMAFAGNDLVNFVGVPLTGLDAYLDYTAHGQGQSDGFLMQSLMGAAKTPPAYLIAAGVVMVLSLMFSKKAQNVVKTSVDLSRQDEGDEMFGSSAAARTIVRSSSHAAAAVVRVLPRGLCRWVNARFNPEGAVLAEGAAFDLIRASVNLVFAGLLVAMGTSQKLPLSTTYVTFMVAMGTSLADRAWSRESAVYRITGVLSVIGGWFITAGVAFIFCYLLTTAMYYGSAAVMVVAIAVAVVLLVRSNIRYARKSEAAQADTTFQRLMRTRDKGERWSLLRQHVRDHVLAEVKFVVDTYPLIADAFCHEEYRALKRAAGAIADQQDEHSRLRRRELIGMRRIDAFRAVERNTWYFTTNNAVEQMLYGLKRVAEPCLNHVANSFPAIGSDYALAFHAFQEQVTRLYMRTEAALQDADATAIDAIRADSQTLQNTISAYRETVMDDIQSRDVNIGAMTVYLNLVQESATLLASLRHALRGLARFAN